MVLFEGPVLKAVVMEQIVRSLFQSFIRTLILISICSLCADVAKH